MKHISVSKVFTAVLSLLLITCFCVGMAATIYHKYPFEEVSRGSRGNVVRQLQQRLIDLNYLSGSADGIYGRGTESAVKAAQKVLGMDRTGVATVRFQEKLFAKSMRSASSGSGKSSGSGSSSSSGSSSGSRDYVGNKNSHIFHTLWCRYVKRMNESNKRYDTRSGLLSSGYRGCYVCNP